MEKILDIITEKMERAFADAGYDASYGRVTVSNRPDLCEYQCNGALAAAKQYHCAPIQIAKAVAEKLDAADYSLVEAVMPGFINLKLSGAFLETYLETMRTAPDFGVAKTGAGKTIVVDYGGANVAKPLHIGHLRPAIIGEAMKRLYAFFGYNTIGDVHLGDWGLQIGLIIAELERPISTRTLRENILPSLPSPCRTWRSFTPPPPPGRRKTKPLPSAPTPRPLNCSRVVAATAPSGSTS